MVFVKVRETYDLHTVRDKMSVIGIHTPSAGIIKANYPGLLMQCKAYRPVSCDVRLACASMLPMDPSGVGTAEGDVAPEDLFNPILYKPISNFGMSQLDGFINSQLGTTTGVHGATVDATNNYGFSAGGDFDIYYGLLSQTHEWKHANPQSGLSISGLKPLVYEVYQTIGDNSSGSNQPDTITPLGKYTPMLGSVGIYRGNAHPLPMLNCTSASGTTGDNVAHEKPGFSTGSIDNYQQDVPAPKVFCSVIVVPPSRLHQLFYRLVCEWTLEFSMIRPISDITSWSELAALGSGTHYMSYSFSSKSLPEETNMVDTSDGSEIHKVM